MKERKGEYKRKSLETEIEVKVDLDGKGINNLQTEIYFLNHMLTLFSQHGFFDLEVKARGDLKVDYHHTVEDIGICLGEAIKNALQDKKGIKRYGFTILPMDESLIQVALDLSGRGQLTYKVQFEQERVGFFEVNLVEEFFRALSYHAGMTLHINLLYGKNSHHIIEAIFKAFGRALDEATRRDDRLDDVFSTKGIID
ncbi:MAG: imidazoleglycerol-phosphate dehydratase HisB [Actinobacteria bacterium]|nr:imidazoleglycerol-phosphate dehydratase HisB [Actinomycetota bacterium]MBE3094078.1 imidazoleglycerol-phosphate dehydratase HisB [Actinomycetota bacterium]MBE3127981.1 imidazoleglycerol-phosphate dehydratase HisB [Candidatus Atribacteria bacterium]